MIKVIVPGLVVTADSGFQLLQNHAVVIEETFIKELTSASDVKKKYPDAVYIEKPDMVLTPGFIQTHIHLCQTLFRGLADDLELLDWLQLRIFPYEHAHNTASLKASVQLGIDELLRGGTTTILDMGTKNHTEVIFEELLSSGIRAFAGKCMIDENDLYPVFKGNLKDELTETYNLAKQYHGSAGGRVNYGFAPRFVLSCSEGLFKEIPGMMKDFPGSVLHTHSSENKKEVEIVRSKTGKENIEYFESLGLFSGQTVLAHCIHVNQNEMHIMKDNAVCVSHCPSSNLKLASGTANIPAYISNGITVSLGADGAPCNNRLSVFKEMHLAALIQKPLHGPTIMDAKTVFGLGTINGAKALGIEKQTGSIEPGKKADLVLLNLEKNGFALSDNPELVYSKIVYSAGPENVDSVMVDGKFVVENCVSKIYDEKKLIEQGKIELQSLLNRV